LQPVIEVVSKLPVHEFSYRQTVATIRCEERFLAIVIEAMKEAYRTIEDYIALEPRFSVSFEPVELNAVAAARLELPDDSPVHRMIRAAAQARTGPMAAVAGVVAWAGLDALMAEGGHGMIENGGDIVVYSPEEFIVEWKIPSMSGDLTGFAFRIPPTTSMERPSDSQHPAGQSATLIDRGSRILGICSSSGKWGHSVSMGNADIATVFSPDPALADACATALANRIKDENDLESAFDFLGDIPGVAGAAAAVDGKVAFYGNCPEVVRLDEIR